MGTQSTVPIYDPPPESISMHEQIGALAFALWEERGRPEGSPETDWFRAKQTLQSEPNG